jgi:hypothetical protein
LLEQIKQFRIDSVNRNARFASVLMQANILSAQTVINPRFPFASHRESRYFPAPALYR